MIVISSLLGLTDEKLLEAYRNASLLNLDKTFIQMLEEELESRELIQPVNYSAS